MHDVLELLVEKTIDFQRHRLYAEEQQKKFFAERMRKYVSFPEVIPCRPG